MSARITRAVKSLLLVLATACMTLGAGLASGQAPFRTYLSSGGSDTNPCTREQPCRLLPAALARVASGGEVWMLDSANFNTGTVIINQSVTILAVPGQVASIVAMDGNPAVTITVPIDVTFRNVAISNFVASPGSYGIQALIPGSITVENGVFTGLPLAGVWVYGGGTVHVRNSVFRDMADSAVMVANGVTLDVSGCTMTGIGYAGVFAVSQTLGTTTLAHVSDTTVSGSNLTTSRGFAVWSQNGGIARGTIVRSRLSRLFVGISLETTGSGTASVNVGSTVLSDNNMNLSRNAGSTARSLGNNHAADAALADYGGFTSLAPR